jgi:AmiR/NasT family two-component response regulator
MRAGPTTFAPGLLVRIVASPGPATEALRRALQRRHARVSVDWPAPDSLPTAGDLLFCTYLPDLPRRIRWTPGEPPLAFIVLLESGQTADPELLRLATCDAVLPHPASPELVAATVAVARDKFLYERRLRGRIERLEETLRALRTVERAKTLLIAERNMTEEQAYAFLRERAMERRVTVGAVAAAYLDNHDLIDLVSRQRRG